MNASLILHSTAKVESPCLRYSVAQHSPSWAMYWCHHDLEVTQIEYFLNKLIVSFIFFMHIYNPMHNVFTYVEHRDTQAVQFNSQFVIQVTSICLIE